MSDARTWIARLGMAGLCFLGTGCGGGGVPDPGSDPSAAVEAPPPQVSGVMPSTVNSAPAPTPAPAPAAAPPAAPQVAQAEPAPVAVATPAPAVIATPASAPAEPVAVAAASAAPGDGQGAAAEEKPQPAAKGDASATNELLNLSSNTTNAAPAAEAAKGEVPVASVPGGPGNIQGPGGVMAGGGPAFGPGNMPGANRGGPGGADGPGGMPGMPGGGNDSNQPANYTTPMLGASTFLNAVKSKNKDRIADATALHAQREAHSAALQKLFTQVLDLSVSDEQVDELAKALSGYVIQSLDMATSTGRQKVVLGKSNGSNGQFRRTLTMRHEAKGWKVCDISGASEIQGFGMPGIRRRTNSR